MKKFVTACLSLLTCHTLYSLPIGNPIEPGLFPQGIWLDRPCCNLDNRCLNFINNWSVRIGYYGDFVFNRNLQIHGNGLGQGDVIDETRLNTNAAYIALNFCDLVDIFTTLGASDLRIHTPEASWSLVSAHEGTLLTNTPFSWSIGARAILFDWRCFSVGIEGQYFRMQPLLTTYISDGFQGRFTYFNGNNRTTYSEWQFGGGLSYTIRTECPDLSIVPYVGVKWSQLHFDTNRFTFVDGFANTLTIFDLSAHKHCGFAVGATFTFCDRIGVTVEGRFADERAFYVNGQICF